MVRKQKNKAGQEIDVIVIPLEMNNLFLGEKGVYLDLAHFELKKESDHGDTHLVKQSLSKEVREAMTEEERNNQPILGNSRPFGGSSSDATPIIDDGDENDDLPF